MMSVTAMPRAIAHTSTALILREQVAKHKSGNRKRQKTPRRGSAPEPPARVFGDASETNPLAGQARGRLRDCLTPRTAP